MFHYKAVRQSSNAEKSGSCGNSRAFGGEENTQSHNHIRPCIRLNSAQCPAPTPQQTQHVKNIESNLYNIIQHMSCRFDQLHTN